MRRRILLVDDDEDGRSMLCDALRSRGFDADCVDSAGACLARLTGSQVEVVVTDVQMPEMSGIELCGVLRTAHPAIQVIVISGIGDTTTAAAARAMGALTFLPKPVRLSELEVVLQHALSRASS